MTVELNQTPVAWITITMKVDINFSHKNSCTVTNLTVSPLINYMFYFVIFLLRSLLWDIKLSKKISRYSKCQIKSSLEASSPSIRWAQKVPKSLEEIYMTCWQTALLDSKHWSHMSYYPYLTLYHLYTIARFIAWTLRKSVWRFSNKVLFVEMVIFPIPISLLFIK